MQGENFYIVKVVYGTKESYVASMIAMMAAGNDPKLLTDDISLAERYPTLEMAQKVYRWAQSLKLMQQENGEFNVHVLRASDISQIAMPVKNPTHFLLKQYSIDENPDCEEKIAQKVKELIWEIEHKDKYLPFKTVLANDNAPGAISYVTDKVLDKVRRYYGIAVGGVLSWQHESLAKRFLYKNTRNELKKYAKYFTFSQKYVDLCNSDRSWSEIDKMWARSLMKCDKDLPNAILALNGYYRLGLMTHGSTPETELTKELYELAHPHSPGARLAFINDRLPCLGKAIIMVTDMVAHMVIRGPDFDDVRDDFTAMNHRFGRFAIRLSNMLADALTTLHPENLGRISQNSDEWENVQLRWPYRPTEDTLALRMMFWLVRKKIVRQALREVTRK